MTDGMQAASQRNRVTTTPAGLHYTQCSSQHARHRPLAPYNLREQRGVGGKSGGETPGPIPNPAVKSTSVDGSAGATPCESRPLPTSSFFHSHRGKLLWTTCSCVLKCAQTPIWPPSAICFMDDKPPEPGSLPFLSSLKFAVPLALDHLTDALTALAARCPRTPRAPLLFPRA